MRLVRQDEDQQYERLAVLHDKQLVKPGGGGAPRTRGMDDHMARMIARRRGGH